MQRIAIGRLMSKAKVRRSGSDEYPVLSITMKDGIVLQGDKFKKRIASQDTADYKMVPCGKLVQGIHIDEGNFGIQDLVPEGIVSPAYTIWDVNDELVIPKYLETALRSPQCIAYYKSKLTGTVNRRGHMSDKDFLGMEIPYLSKDGQQKALNILDQAKQVVITRQQQLQQLDELIKARFVEMFGDPISNPKGWNVFKLSDCLVRIDNGKSFTCDNAPRKGSYPAVLKLSAATYGDYRPDENKALLDESQFVEAAEVHAGDLLFTRKNTPELVGMAAYVFETPEHLMMPDLIFRLVPNDKMNPVYLWQLINNREFRPVIQSISGGSAKSMSNISKERLGNIDVICPPITEQVKIEEVLKQVAKSKVVGMNHPVTLVA